MSIQGNNKMGPNENKISYQRNTRSSGSRITRTATSTSGDRSRTESDSSSRGGISGSNDDNSVARPSSETTDDSQGSPINSNQDQSVRRDRSETVTISPVTESTDPEKTSPLKVEVSETTISTASGSSQVNTRSVIERNNYPSLHNQDHGEQNAPRFVPRSFMNRHPADRNRSNYNHNFHYSPRGYNASRNYRGNNAYAPHHSHSGEDFRGRSLGHSFRGGAATPLLPQQPFFAPYPMDSAPQFPFSQLPVMPPFYAGPTTGNGGHYPGPECPCDYCKNFREWNNQTMALMTQQPESLSPTLIQGQPILYQRSQMQPTFAAVVSQPPIQPPIHAPFQTMTQPQGVFSFQENTTEQNRDSQSIPAMTQSFQAMTLPQQTLGPVGQHSPHAGRPLQRKQPLPPSSPAGGSVSRNPGTVTPTPLLTPLQSPVPQVNGFPNFFSGPIGFFDPMTGMGFWIPPPPPVMQHMIPNRGDMNHSSLPQTSQGGNQTMAGRVNYVLGPNTMNAPPNPSIPSLDSGVTLPSSISSVTPPTALPVVQSSFFQTPGKNNRQ